MLQKMLPCLILLALCIGCGDGPTIVPVSGTATHGGEPAAGLFLNFKPESGRPSWAVTDESGHFSLSYSRDEDGAVLGTHKVWVRSRPTSLEQEIAQSSGGGRDAATAEILQKYGREESSPLTVEITEATDELELRLD